MTYRDDRIFMKVPGLPGFHQSVLEYRKEIRIFLNVLDYPLDQLLLNTDTGYFQRAHNDTRNIFHRHLLQRELVEINQVREFAEFVSNLQENPNGGLQ